MGDRGSSCGGAVSVGESGVLYFLEFASFEENLSERGGALCNRGFTTFDRRTFFTGNSASAVGKSVAKPSARKSNSLVRANQTVYNIYGGCFKSSVTATRPSVGAIKPTVARMKPSINATEPCKMVSKPSVRITTPWVIV